MPTPSGWLVIDKPRGLSSSRAVAVVQRSTGAKVGHAGTLDPLATGVLPVAVGEATKLTLYVMAGKKRYRFTVRWGIARDTDDREGAITGESAARPAPAAIEALLPRFTGTIAQRPPAYSAIHVGGRRAYALARADKLPNLPPRPVEIYELRLLDTPDRDHAVLEALVGKGAYIRALARDLAQALGTLGHVHKLRRLAVGRFTEEQAISLDFVAEHGHIAGGCGYLLPIETALDDIPALVLTATDAIRLCHGQCVTPSERGSLDPLGEGAIVGVFHDRMLIAMARIENGGLRPVRIINR
jgi:tRNA pseudouridine55 synthase